MLGVPSAGHVPDLCTAVRLSAQVNLPSTPWRDAKRRRAALVYRDSPNKVTSRCIVDSLRHKDFIYGVVVTPFGEVL
jgi:hypothetical protein